jgi:hypothetical protein
MSEQTNTILETISSPIVAKNPLKDSMARSFPTEQAGYAEVDLIDERQVFVGLAYWISSTPIASIWPSLR